MDNGSTRRAPRSRSSGLGAVWADSKEDSRLDRAEVVRTALELLEEQGLDAFSLRGLATALNIKSPSLYWYIQSRDELFDLIVDAVLAEFQLPDGDDDRPWNEQLVAIATELRRVLLGRPVATRLLTGRVPLVPSWLRIAEHVIGALRRAGFADEMANYCYLVLLYYVIGFVSQEIAFGAGPESLRRLEDMHEFVLKLPADRYPNLIAVTENFGERGLEDRFELGLAGIMLGIADKRG